MNFKLLLTGIVLGYLPLFAQQRPKTDPCRPKSTIVVFRTFNLISLALSYKLFAGDSLLGRMNTHKVFIIETNDSTFSLSASIKTPSLNATRKSHYSKTKKINYTFSIKPGGAYLVKCGFLNQDVFNHPRQPTIRLLKGKEGKRFMKRPFIKRKVRRYLYRAWSKRQI